MLQGHVRQNKVSSKTLAFFREKLKMARNIENMTSKTAKKGGEHKKEAKKNFPLLNYNHLKRFSIVITSTFVIVLSFVGLGYWLDLKLGTKPWLLIILTIISFPITQLVVYRKMKEFTKKEFKRLNIKVKE